MHTKEPWVVGQSKQFGLVHFSVDETFGFAPRSIALTGVVGDIDEEESIANARRIVACVNACAGLDTSFVEQSSMLSLEKSYSAQCQENAHVWQQRDDLLSALKAIIADDRAAIDPDDYIAAKAVIAKADLTQ